MSNINVVTPEDVAFMVVTYAHVRTVTVTTREIAEGLVTEDRNKGLQAFIYPIWNMVEVPKPSNLITNTANAQVSNQQEASKAAGA